MVPHMDIFFEIPASEVTAVGVQLDTNSLSDGEHTVTAVSGGATKEAKVIAVSYTHLDVYKRQI